MICFTGWQVVLHSLESFLVAGSHSYPLWYITRETPTNSQHTDRQ